MDFMMKIGFSLTMDRVHINHHSPVTSSPNTIDFLYNMNHGRFIRRYKKRRNEPMYKKYLRGDLPQLEEQPEVVIQYNVEANEEESIYSDEDILELHAEDENLDDL